MKIITCLKELFMLSYYISISYFSDNLIQISDKCMGTTEFEWVNLDPGIEIHFTLFLAYALTFV